VIQRLKPIALSTLHASHLKALRGARVLSATTTEPGFNDESSHPLRLKRFVDFDNHAPRLFAFEMQGLLEIARRARGALGTLRAPLSGLLTHKS
jgi:hypothetical protein